MRCSKAVSRLYLNVLIWLGHLEKQKFTVIIKGISQRKCSYQKNLLPNKCTDCDYSSFSMNIRQVRKRKKYVLYLVSILKIPRTHVLPFWQMWYLLTLQDPSLKWSGTQQFCSELRNLKRSNPSFTSKYIWSFQIPLFCSILYFATVFIWHI